MPEDLGVLTAELEEILKEHREFVRKNPHGSAQDEFTPPITDNSYNPDCLGRESVVYI